jgi:hypothetical protein
MFIFLADCSKERGQRKVLIQELYVNFLSSYAYTGQQQSFIDTQKYWEELLRIHLASTSHEVFNGKGVRYMLPEENHINSLASYAYLDSRHELEWSDSSNQTTENNKNDINDLRPRVIIDSGAFTAFTTGKTINPKDYATWSLDFQKRWEHKMKSLSFMNLDVIGNQDDSWKNQSILESLGMKPIPIITFGCDKKHLIRALDNYDYIALGGLVPHSRNKIKLQKWLDYCFNIIMGRYKETGVMPRIHLLGITTDWVLKRYPCYSSDSSSWVACLRFGGGTAAGLDKIPRYKESDAALSATIHTLRSEVVKYKKMETEATNLWKSRGIIWDD